MTTINGHLGFHDESISVTIFKQSLDTPAIIGIILILSGVIVMNVFSKAAAH